MEISMHKSVPGLVGLSVFFASLPLAASDLAGGRDRILLYLRAAIGAAIPISLYGIAQYFGWDVSVVTRYLPWR